MIRLWRSPLRELCLFAVAANLMFAYRYLGSVADGHPQPVLVPFIQELTGVMGAGVLFFGVRRLARRFPMTRGTLSRDVPLHLAILLVYSATHTSLNWMSRAMLFPLTGLGRYRYGRMPVRYAMEFPIDVISYVAFVTGIWMFDRYAASRERELRTVQLERQLAEARLRTLRLQLQPHFLFNALNTVSSIMYEDPARADTMLSELAELLRLALRTEHTQQVALSLELEALDRYLSLMRARFADHLDVVRRIDPGALDALVPSLLLQPLVENAIRHGNLGRTGQGRMQIRIERAGGRLSLVVADDGPGVATDPASTEGGVGLSATAERLRLLYGSDHRFMAGNTPGGGFAVTIVLPFIRASQGSIVSASDRETHASAHR